MKRRLLAGLLLLCAVCLCTADSLAAETGRKGSLTVLLRSGAEPVSGGVLVLYYIGSALDVELTPEHALELEKQMWGDSGKRCAVGMDGRAFFAELKTGVYLVSQPETAVGYRKMRPFIVSVPMMQDGAWIYDICAYPKTEKLPEDPLIPDTGQVYLPLLLLILSAGGLLILLLGRKQSQ